MAVIAQSANRMSADEVAASKHLESVDIVDESTLAHPSFLSAGVSTSVNSSNQMGMTGASNQIQMNTSNQIQMNNANGMSMNGMNAYQTNNMTPNGMQNGMQMNGYQTNSMGVNAQMNGSHMPGYSNMNGRAMPNGMYANGMNQNGMYANGMNQNGMYANGMNQNGMYANGMNQNGMYANGMNQNGMYNNGMNAGSDPRAVEQAIGMAGTAVLLSTFLNNGGVGGMLRQVGWGNTGFHSHGLCGY